VPIVLKSGSLNLLEPSGPVQTCNGTDNIYTHIYILFERPGSRWDGYIEIDIN
jgi:hypothetical protein